MKIQLNQPWDDGNKTFKKFAVLQMADSDALPLIAQGIAHRVPDDTRLFVSETLITACVTPAAGSAPSPLEGGLGGDITPSGQELTLDELTAEKPQEVSKKSRFRL